VLDPRVLREQPEAVRAAAALKRIAFDVDRALEVDRQRRTLIHAVEEAKAEQTVGLPYLRARITRIVEPPAGASLEQEALLRSVKESLDRAVGLGASALATGHYARIVREDEGRFRLLRGLDHGKDQSYFLFSLTQAQMAQARFPIGHLDKPTVREHARRLGLRVAEKPDSQEICFVPDNDYAAFVEREAPELTRAGAIVSADGRVMGTHEGVHRFTVGQRKGLRLSSSDPLYVVAIDAASARVTVGPKDALDRASLSAAEVNWTSGTAPGDWTPAAAQIRHRHAAASGRVRALDARRAEFVFDEPQSAVTPGQAVVFYEGEEVVGGGWIE